MYIRRQGGRTEGRRLVWLASRKKQGSGEHWRCLSRREPNRICALKGVAWLCSAEGCEGGRRVVPTYLAEASVHLGAAASGNGGGGVEKRHVLEAHSLASDSISPSCQLCDLG